MITERRPSTSMWRAMPKSKAMRGKQASAWRCGLLYVVSDCGTLEHPKTGEPITMWRLTLWRGRRDKKRPSDEDVELVRKAFGFERGHEDRRVGDGATRRLAMLPEGFRGSL